MPGGAAREFSWHGALAQGRGSKYSWAPVVFTDQLSKACSFTGIK